MNKKLLPHRFLKQLMVSHIILKGMKPTKLQGYEQRIKMQVREIRHPHFRKDYLNILRGHKKIKYKEELKRDLSDKAKVKLAYKKKLQRRTQNK